MVSVTTFSQGSLARNPHGRSLSTPPNLTEAKQAAEDKRREARAGDLPNRGRKPTFATVADECLALAAKKKKPRTVEEDKHRLNRWKAALGHVRVDLITTPMIAAQRDKRLLCGVSPRTVNLDLIAIRAVFKKCVEDGLIVRNPMDKVTKLKQGQRASGSFFARHNCRVSSRRPSPRTARGARNTETATSSPTFLKLLAYSGAREQEALRLRWSDVDSQRKQLTIGADGDTKNSKSRRVDFSDSLEAHLRDMANRRDPESVFLFPSPQRGTRDEAARTLRETLRLVRAAVGLDKFMPHFSSDERKLQSRAGVGFHDMRHHFASICVMSGVPFRQIAEWLGHSDGGVLVGKVYGHLDPDFGHRAARKVAFHLEAVQREEEPERGEPIRNLMA